jgi:hypothetical protein
VISEVDMMVVSRVARSKARHSLITHEHIPLYQVSFDVREHGRAERPALKDRHAQIFVGFTAKTDLIIPLL